VSNCSWISSTYFWQKEIKACPGWCFVLLLLVCKRKKEKEKEMAPVLGFYECCGSS
jgi:hypothetical protein